MGNDLHYVGNDLCPVIARRDFCADAICTVKVGDCADRQRPLAQTAGLAVTDLDGVTSSPDRGVASSLCDGEIARTMGPLLRSR